MLTFMGIGAQKAGTTWMYHHLSRHPAIAFPLDKEIHYWNLLYPDGYPVEKYSTAFELAPGKICGEITPDYAILPEGTVRAISQRFPHLRLVMILRNPLERAWSAALMDMIRTGHVYEDTPDQWFLDYFKSPEPLARGDYATSIRLWGSLFQPGALRVLFLEELRADPVCFLQTVAVHIGADPSFYKESEVQELRKKIFSVGNMPLRETLFEPLMEIYDSGINDLAGLLGKDLSYWKQPPRMAAWSSQNK